MYERNILSVPEVFNENAYIGYRLSSEKKRYGYKTKNELHTTSNKFRYVLS